MAMINIGSQKQLFLDDYLVESMTHTRRVMNAAEKAADNPVLRPERPWEGNDLRISQVIYDEQEQVFKMWYRSATYTPVRDERGVIVVRAGEGEPIDCLATSDDGINWQRPVIGAVQFQGNKQNNILPPSSVMPTFIRDLHETDPAKRYKALTWTMDVNAPMQLSLHYSADAFHWTPYQNNPVMDTAPRVGRWGPDALMGWDPIRKVYAIHIENSLHRQSPSGKRLIGRSESADMIHWSEPETILVPDDLDPPDIEFYGMPALVYEGIYVALPWIFSTTNTTHHPELAVGRDGVHYQREFRSPFIPRGSRTDFDGTSIYAHAPIVHGDRILTFYNGASWRSPDQLMAQGNGAHAAIGLAVTRLDGFVSLDGVKGLPDGDPPKRKAPAYSEMVTRSFSFAGSRLHLNVQPVLQQWGWSSRDAASDNILGCEVRVEILAPNHAYIPGYEFDDADSVNVPDGLDQIVSWNGQSDISRLSGKTIKLRFHFKNCKLYSYWFR